MLIGITLGFALGIILLLVGIIGMIVSKFKCKSNQWPLWVFVAGGCAIFTAVINMLKVH